jgi:hypothetical protein
MWCRFSNSELSDTNGERKSRISQVLSITQKSFNSDILLEMLGT